MNRYLDNPGLKAVAFFILIIAFNLSIPSATTAFQVGLEMDDTIREFDHVINRRGESRLSVFTGIPVVASTEYAVGISGRLTVGVFGGFTPVEEAVGIRVRTVLYQRDESYRVYFCTPIIFYPQTRRLNPDPWFVTRPNINFEWLSNSNLRYKVGASLVAGASHHNIFGDPSKSKHSPGLWTAVHGGLSTPVSSNMTFQAELSYVTRGFKTVSHFLESPPVILMIGVSTTF